jgi:acetoin utilization deacetylase AcuC-like enzyme
MVQIQFIQSLPSVMLPIGREMNLYYSDSYIVASYAFDTTRKAGWIAESLRSQPIAGVELVEPVPVTEEQLLLAHAATYVRAVKSGSPLWLAESQGFDWDPQLWQMVCASTGGVIGAARAASQDGIAGSLSTGLHHARHDTGDGFCTFNGLAIAAQDALARGAKSVLILDLDAHCGGGTHSLVGHDPRIHLADVAASSYDYYKPARHNRLELVQDAAQYLPVVETVLTDLEHTGQFDLCLYNAGMDPHEGCSIGGLPGITATLLHQRERLVFPWLRLHARAVAFVLAGGYVSGALTQDALVALHRLTIECAANNPARADG